MSEQRTVVLNPAAAEAEPTQLAAPAPAAPADATQQAISLACPVCEAQNLPGDVYCQDCGFLLGSEQPVEALPDLSTLPHLVAVEDGGGQFPLTEGVNHVGREAGEILLSDLTVSRDHAAVLLEEGRLFVEDHGSTNGSRVGNQPLTPGQRVELFSGDELRFGNVRLTVQIPAGEARPPGSLPAAASEPASEPAPPVDRGEPLAELVLEDGTAYPLYVGANSIGRRSSNDIALSGDPFLSGSHAEIRCEADGSLLLVDVGSTNGSFIGGERLAPHEPRTVAPGDSFRLGKTVVTLGAVVASEAPSPAAADADSGEPDAPGEPDEPPRADSEEENDGEDAQPMDV